MSAPPFGLILPSRPVLVSPAAVSATQYAFSFPATPAFSHIVVFLLPGIVLPDETLAGVYIQLPGATATPQFKFVGAIGNVKPSAIFRVSQGAQESSTIKTGDMEVEDEMTDVDGAGAFPAIDGSGMTSSSPVTVGISIEPAANIAAQLESLKASWQLDIPSTTLVRASGQAARVTPVTTKLLAQRIIKNAFNFLASFGEDKVPLKSFQDWWTKFERRIENDPTFLERNEQD